MSRVLDPSIAVKWYLSDELSPGAVRILERVESEGAVVPALFRWEVENVLRLSIESGRIGEDGLDDALASLRALPIAVDSSGDRLMFGSELALATSCNLTLYDAAYLELALDRGIPLATADDELAYAAREHGIDVEAA
jgi:predicted nucleic acid-binding protein